MLTNRRRRRRTALPEPTHDRRGYRRSPVTLPSYRQGKPAANKGLKYPAEPLTSAEVRALIAACERPVSVYGGKATYATRRNQALITIYWRCGLRRVEALDLYPKDVDLERGTVTILLGKGKK